MNLPPFLANFSFSRYTYKPAWISVLLIGLLILLTTVSIILKSGQPLQSEENSISPSIYNTNPSGYEAFYEVLRRVGVLAMPWRQPYHKLAELQNPSLLWINASGAIKNNTENAEQLLAWVSNGNTLVYVIRNSDPFFQDELSPLLQNGHIRITLARRNARPVSIKRNLYYPLTVAEKPLHAFLHYPLLSQSPIRLQLFTNTPDIETVLEDADHMPVMLRFPWGKGNIILSSAPDMGENGYLFLKNDNYQFLSNLLLSEQKPVYFDEYSHGYFESPDMMSYIQKTPLAYVFAQCVFVFCLLLWLSFKPWKPPRKVASEPAIHPILAFVNSISVVYIRVKGASAVLKPILHRIDRTLLKRYRIHSADAKPLQHLLHQVVLTTFEAHSPFDTLKEPLSAESLQAALEKARQVVHTQKPLTPKETFSLIQTLSYLQEGLDHGFRKPFIQPAVGKHRAAS